jgi:signal transduction histidine kinase/CheY-like chemotaxis protein
MEKLKARLQVSFSTKVLVPVVTTMVLLLAVTVWLVNRRITRQFETASTDSLKTAERVFLRFRKIRRQELLFRYHNLPSEPRYKAVFQQADPPTLRDSFSEFLGGHHMDGVDVILYTTDKQEPLAIQKRDPEISTAEFEVSSALVVKQALLGQEKVDTIGVGGRLFDVVSIPVLGTGDHLIGALTLGSEVGETAAQELRDVAQCQIVLLGQGQVVVATLPGPEWHDRFARLFNDYAPENGSEETPAPIKSIQLSDEHYFWKAGRFPSLGGDDKLGYLLFSSYELPLRAMHNTQQMLLLLSALGILTGTAIVWILIKKVTQPLRALRDSAEAVGRGDFSRRVQVFSRDECGELAEVFNQMTENLKSSREQLEMTVDTLKNTQAQLIQSEKLSGIGEFVAGVAHELNNPLTSVMGFSELLKRDDKDPKHVRFLDMIHKSALRCQKIVQSLLSFARRHQPERKLANVNELVESTIEILHYQMRTSNIEVSTRLEPDLPKAMVDAHQIQQVFLNLINNARQAVEAHRPSGWVRISTEQAGENARITFEDNGPGIPEAHLSKVFDPFFTTKEVGKGTGLGLSLCYGIIQEHGGTISVRSKLGSGATFIIELPLAQIAHSTSSPIPTAIAPSVSPALPSREGVGKKVLVIDDEEPILHMVREALTEHGYEVDFAQDGETALQRLNQVPYDLALCDWKMPGLNGQQVYERLRASNPALSDRMIFITGDVINHKTQQFLQESNKVCLTKPFSLADFRTAIGKALAA